METLSALIEKYLHQDEDIPEVRALFVPLEKPVKFSFLFSEDRRGGRTYHINADFGVPPKMPKGDLYGSMADFLQKFGGEVEESHLTLTTAEQGLSIEQRYVPEFQLQAYSFQVTMAEKETKKVNVPLIAETLQRLYGLRMNSRYERYGNFPFSGKNTDGEGISVWQSSGLKHGTLSEQDAYKAMQHLREHASLEDLKALRAYDSALLESKPKTDITKGILLQRAGPFSIQPYVNFFKEVPKEVEEMSLFTEHPDEVMLYVQSSKPNFQLTCFTDREDEAYGKIDQFWDYCTKITGLELKAVEEAIVREREKDLREGK